VRTISSACLCPVFLSEKQNPVASRSFSLSGHYSAGPGRSTHSSDFQAVKFFYIAFSPVVKNWPGPGYILLNITVSRLVERLVRTYTLDTRMDHYVS
jgi:hypothetical protein